MSESEKANAEKNLAGLKKSKYALLKNEKDLNEQQSQKLAEVKEVSPLLKSLHEFKEKIRQIFEETNDWLAGLWELGRWLDEAQKYFPNSHSYNYSMAR